MSIRAELDAIAARNNPKPPSKLGVRYDAHRFLPEAGNTVVCHLDRSDPAHKAVLAARSAIQNLPGADHLLFTAEDSLHMTVFDGIIDTGRTADAWPAGMDLTAPVDEVTNELRRRLTDFVPPPAFKVSVSSLYPGGLHLDGATAQDRANMRAWRDALTAPFGLRRKNHDTYTFHMTFAYTLQWLPDDLVPVWETALQRIEDDLIKAAPVIPLAPPAFCSFADMDAFPELLVLAP